MLAVPLYRRASSFSFTNHFTYKKKEANQATFLRRKWGYHIPVQSPFYPECVTHSHQAPNIWVSNKGQVRFYLCLDRLEGHNLPLSDLLLWGGGERAWWQSYARAKAPRGSLPSVWQTSRVRVSFSDSPATIAHCCTAGRKLVVLQRCSSPLLVIQGVGNVPKEGKEHFAHFASNEDWILLQLHQQPPSTDTGNNHT